VTALRRAALGLLTVLLLAVAAGAVGYAVRQPTGPDIQGAVDATPSAVAHDAEPASEAPAEAAPTPTAAPVPAVVPATANPVPQAPPRAEEIGVPLLSPGDEGDDVRDLQARLKQLAWFFGDVTGTFGDHTTEAVRGFQDKRGIPVTGKVDRRTLDRLRSMSDTPTHAAKHNLGNQPGPLDARCRTGRVLCIDKTSKTLRWVVDGTVVETVDVRFGSSATPTREGVFSVDDKSRDHVSSLYDSPMPFAMFFSGGQAVHYSSDFASNGYYGASHGCVNVRDYDAVAWLFDEVDLGDKVVVYWS
jgi:peptidoglycan hydrolase-like protein with peptidoglycan-binding domain